MSSVKTLELVFGAQGGKEIAINIVDPREDIKFGEVQAVAKSILEKNIFEFNGLDLAQFIDSRLVTKDTVSLKESKQ